MEFKFIVKKWANFYFFLQNLSEWHFRVRKNYNLIWKKELGPFSQKEKALLQKLKKLHLKYGFGEKYLGQYFYLKKNPWKTLAKQLTRKERKELQNIFSAFESKFEILWKRELPLLKKWQKKLQKETNLKSLIEPIAKTLSQFYNQKAPQKIKVYLLLSPTGIGGTANLKNRAITLEISRYSQKKSKKAIGLVWHEVIHAFYEDYLLELLNKKLPQIKDKKLKNSISEATARAFFPSGILGKKFLKLKEKPEIPKKIQVPFLKLIKKYLKLRKPCDLDFVTKSLDLFQRVEL